MSPERNRETGKALAQSIPQTPTPRSSATANGGSKTLSSEQVWNVVLAVLAFVLAVVGVQEVYPLTLNLIIYAISLVLILSAIWRWEKAGAWSAFRRVFVLVISGLGYCWFLSYPILKQYQKEINIKLSFKDSPQMTWWREQVITYDLYRMQTYLSGLGIPVPSSLPPISVGTGALANETGSSTPPNLPVNRGSLMIGSSKLNDRKSMTQEYTSYVVQQQSTNVLGVFPNFVDGIPLLMMGNGLAGYFNASYWKEKPPMFFPSGDILWSVRSSLGEPFADKLAGASLQVLNENPTDIKSSPGDLAIEQARMLMLADSVVESECDKWPQIRDLLIQSGVPKDKIKSQKFVQSSQSSSCVEKWSQ